VHFYQDITADAPAIREAADVRQAAQYQLASSNASVPQIVPDPISFSTHHIHMGFLETDTVLSSATAFTYERGGEFYLITNWHNVTGRDPLTRDCISPTLATPDVIVTFFREQSNPANLAVEHLKLFVEGGTPLWFEHPQFGYRIDVVALRLPTEFETRYRLRPINRNGFDPQFKPEVADDAFVIGYPFSDPTEARLPIWKRASIATEPDVDVDQLPKLLLDTATRSGLSGSPVLMQRVGIHGVVDGQFKADSMFGRIRNFLGVYSGRIGTDELKAQLGIVWKARVIDEIIDGRTFGIAKHEV
jgi:hypothetical protein